MEISSGNQMKQTIGAGTAMTADNYPDGRKAELAAEEMITLKITDEVMQQARDAVTEIPDPDNVQDKKSETERKSDSTEFSNDSHAYVKSEEELRQRELELLLGKLWLLLKEWQPHLGKGLPQEIGQLQEIYQQLLKEILKSHTREQAAMQDGILYSKGPGKKVNVNQRYQEQVQEDERFRLQSPEKTRKMADSTGILRLHGDMYSITDIERAERFVQYLSEKGSLYGEPGLSAKNEELV